MCVSVCVLKESKGKLLLKLFYAGRIDGYHRTKCYCHVYISLCYFKQYVNVC